MECVKCGEAQQIFLITRHWKPTQERLAVGYSNPASPRMGTDKLTCQYLSSVYDTKLDTPETNRFSADSDASFGK